MVAWPMRFAGNGAVNAAWSFAILVQQVQQVSIPFLLFLNLIFFLDFEFRLMNIDIYTFLGLDDKEIINYKLGKNFDHFVFKIYSLVKDSKFNIFLIEKFIFLFNYSSNRAFYLKFLERYIRNSEFNFNNLPNISNYLVNPFNVVGDFKTAKKLSLMELTEQKRCYVSTYGLENWDDNLINPERIELEQNSLVSLFEYWKKKISKGDWSMRKNKSRLSPTKIEMEYLNEKMRKLI